ncbi:PilC/PilY family type IV pilus protein [Psychrobium sp. 1_MG-2023]|uniref:PilC/PilY family type IV pilus protein n=1 Tax=Psychrobium sp. 1_MG-2023 TaxID=3062624 RepID=UPI000C32D548|nr:PilC/PilY family type IV pilus protein [Psychrobium sp. 1_MG-2023]MDP2561850.1 PilC/PilY family type IV pilus protein [Psychrobium sp. 1_MG-2023]PKF55779.1 hypothetical protein CW748_11595 [Alteromonadales bacterium alter-6D02]
MNTWTRKIALFFSGVALPLLAIPTAQADDTEIFYKHEAKTPKVMMILDTSLSMSAHVKDTESRLTQMKSAMREFIRDAKEIEVGIMRMNQIGSAVVYPVSDLTTTVTETLSAINRPITNNSHNAYEKSNGVVVYDHKGSNTALPVNNSEMIALHFPNITIPRDQSIKKASLEFFHHNSCIKIKNNGDKQKINCPKHGKNAKVKIYAHKISSSPQLKKLTNNLTTRTKTSNNKSVSTDLWNSSGKRVTTITGLENIIQEVVEQSKWKNGNDLTLLLDTSDAASDLKTNGIINAVGRYSPTLFIEFEPYSRTINTREKMIEELDNQKLTYHTPIIPSLLEATKYLQGARLDSPSNPGLTLSRSATERTELDQVHERVAYPTSYSGGSITYPVNCHKGNLNSTLCRGVKINPISESNIPTYKTPLTDTCNDDEASIVLLTDGAAHHKKDSYNTNKWWYKMTTDIATLTGAEMCKKITGNNGNPQTCGVELSTHLAEGVAVNGISDKQKISLYTIGFNNNDPFLTTLAAQGDFNENGEPTEQALKRYSTATDSASLLKVFQNIASQIRKDSASFANSPASINTANRLTHNNNLYFALFQPGDNASWDGNLKHYKLSSSGKVVDADGKVATNPSTGQFLDTARSYWTATADGSKVASGGAAEQIEKHVDGGNSRAIFTNLGNTNLDKLDKSDTSNFTISDFAVTSESDKETLIKWMVDSKRIADPLHSTPIEVQHKNGDLIFFGDNQGYIHAIDSTTGKEVYAFIPQELLKIQKAVKANIQSTDHIYGMDGEMVKWQISNDKVYIYSGMRRGGSSYYALDVSDRTKPKLLWRIHKGKSGFSDLGQTWSKPIKTKIQWGSSEKDVLIFGGGYDKTQDAKSTRAGDTKGDGVYIVGAEDGTLIWSKTNMGYSIPSDIKVIDINGDKKADQFYVGDMGGQVWRFDLPQDNKKTVGGGVIASISGSTASSNRRFYHAPDISVLEGSAGQTLAVAIGSGYRAHPNNTVIADSFYMFKQPLDNSAKTYTKITLSDLYDATSNLLGSGSDAQKNIALNSLKASEGWQIKLTNSGEKVLASSITFNGAIWFTTYQPRLGANVCQNLRGISRLYRVNVYDGTPDYKNVLPDVDTSGNLDESKDCDKVSCDATDRSVHLKNTTLPPRPTLLNIDGKRMIGVSTEFYPAVKNKTTTMYWAEKE